MAKGNADWNWRCIHVHSNRLCVNSALWAILNIFPLGHFTSGLKTNGKTTPQHADHKNKALRNSHLLHIYNFKYKKCLLLRQNCSRYKMLTDETKKKITFTLFPQWRWLFDLLNGNSSSNKWPLVWCRLKSLQNVCKNGILPTKPHHPPKKIPLPRSQLSPLILSKLTGNEQ